MNSWNQLIEDAKSWVLQENQLEEKVFYPRKTSLRVEKETPANCKPSIKTGSSIEVLLVSFKPQEPEKHLAERLSKAIDDRIAKAHHLEASTMESQDQWKSWFSENPNVRHVLISEVDFYQMPNLMKNYQRMPKRSIFNIPLFFLADLKSYNQDASLKKDLWATLLSEL